MPKYIYYLTAIAGIFALSVVVHLAVRNWSPKISEPIIAVFAGAVTAMFITIVSILKPVDIQDRVIATIVVDRKTFIPLGIVEADIPGSFLQNAAQTLIVKKGVDEFGKQFWQEGLAKKSPIEVERQFNDLILFTIYRNLWSALQADSVIMTSRTIGSDLTVVNARLQLPYRIQNGDSIPWESTLSLFASNEFFTTAGKEMWDREFLPWENKSSSFPVPSGARIVCGPSSISFKRDGYYDITFSIKLIRSCEGIPHHLIGKLETSDVSTKFYAIDMRAHFFRLSVESRTSREAQLWAAFAFSELKASTSMSQLGL